MHEALSNREPGTFWDLVSQPTVGLAASNRVNLNTTIDSDSWESDRIKVLAWLQQNVPESRLQHILRVEALAVELASCHGLDPQQAAQAGLMHDLAKYFKPARLLEMATAEGLSLDPVEEINPHLLHAEVGAIVARDQFGVQDRQVLDAIRNHTLGRPEMDGLSCVVYLADSLEPGRGETVDLERLRHLSHVDLVEAVWRTCDYTLQHLLAQHQFIHPRAVSTRNGFLSCFRKRSLTT
jgi:predicted HD superfamily hydrolase involved in NAD metabolism